MLRETRVFECFNADDIYDAVEFANNRTDGGKTTIKLNRHYAPYIMNKLILFKKTASHLDFDLDGLTMTNVTPENDWKIDRIVDLDWKGDA